MKTVRLFLPILGFILAIAASFAFRPEPPTTVYQYISGAHPQCSETTASCPGGQTACTVSSIQVRDSNDVMNSCGNLLTKQ